MLCQLTVRTHEGVCQESVDSWTGLVVMAALSAEPECFDELAAAVRRYQPEHHLFQEVQATSALANAEAEGPWCLIDLCGRTVVASAGVDLPDLIGAYEPSPDEEAEGFPIVWLDTPGDWLFRTAEGDWRDEVPARAAARRAGAAALDARPVLFGAPLLEHLADGVLAAAKKGFPDEQEVSQLTRTVHANWLMTPRADLNGRTPRAVLLADANRLCLDVEHRSLQWSRQGHAVPPLPKDSTAYRLGGFGTTEVILYFDLVRALLAEAWELVEHTPQLAKPTLVRQLAAERDRWLNEPYEGGGAALSPVELIESERRRMPVTGDGSHLDCDCPICQAMAEGSFGPAFLGFDGHHLELEDEFAFSLCASRAEWDRRQEHERELCDEIDRKELERFAADVDDPATDSVWKASFVDWDRLAGPDDAPAGPLLALSFPLAELVSDLKSRPGGHDLLRTLNAAYAALRSSEDRSAAVSAAQALRDQLEAISQQFPELTPKSADLQSRVDEVFRQVT